MDFSFGLATALRKQGRSTFRALPQAAQGVGFSTFYSSLCCGVTCCNPLTRSKPASSTFKAVKPFLETSIEFLSGVGPERAKLLKQEFGIKTYSDLLHHFPFRYVDRTQFHQINSIENDGNGYPASRTNFISKNRWAKSRTTIGG